MKVLCVGNQKGGVSKTTTSLNLCYSLANTYNQRVLLIDMDSQGSASLNLQIDVASDDIHTIDELLEPIVLRHSNHISWEYLQEYIYTPTFTDRVRDPEKPVKWIQVQKPYGFDLIPSSLYLSIVEMKMGIAAGKFFNGSINQFYLRETIIKTLREHSDYDYVVIDTPPSLGALSVNSMAAAVDGVIIVSNLDVMSTRGIESFIESTETVQRANDNHRGIMGILFALYSDRRSVDKQVDSWAKQFLPIPVFDTRIPETANVKKANSSKLLVSQIDKKMKTAYDSFAEEVIYATDHPTEPIGSAKRMSKEEAEDENGIIRYKDDYNESITGE